MPRYAYALIEDGYQYAAGFVDGTSAEDALENACKLAQPAPRECYGPDDGSEITITHGVTIYDDETGTTAKRSVSFTLAADCMGAASDR